MQAFAVAFRRFASIPAMKLRIADEMAQQALVDQGSQITKETLPVEPFALCDFLGQVKLTDVVDETHTLTEAVCR